MQRIASKRGKEIWLHELRRPYRFTAPFGGDKFVCALFVNDPHVSQAEQSALSEQIVDAGCRYALCAGKDCSSWDDAIDMAYVMKNLDKDEDEQAFVMTTWHENESPEEILYFAISFTDFDDHVFDRYLVLLIGPDEKVRQEVVLAAQAAI